MRNGTALFRDQRRVVVIKNCEDRLAHFEAKLKAIRKGEKPDHAVRYGGLSEDSLISLITSNMEAKAAAERNMGKGTAAMQKSRKTVQLGQTLTSVNPMPGDRIKIVGPPELETLEYIRRV